MTKAHAVVQLAGRNVRSSYKQGSVVGTIRSDDELSSQAKAAAAGLVPGSAVRLLFGWTTR